MSSLCFHFHFHFQSASMNKRKFGETGAEEVDDEDSLGVKLD